MKKNHTKGHDISMFKVNDMIVYGANGVCRITDVEEKKLTREKKKYFVLSPVKSVGSVYYVPVDNEKLVAKMRKLLSEDEINELIDAMAGEHENWIENETERKERYREIISAGEPKQLIGIIKAIFFEKKRREEDGKRLHASDERFLKDAEQLLHGEFQYVLNLSQDELMRYIFDRIEKSSK